VARVLPDVPAIDKTFDYAIPDALADQMRVGTIVRIPLHGRRVRGWVVELPNAPATDRPLQPIAKVTGWGPPADVLDLASWAAWRWAGKPATLLRTASPPVAVRGLPPPPASGHQNRAIARDSVPRNGGGDVAELVAEGLTLPAAVLRLPPAADASEAVVAAMGGRGSGSALVLAPSLAAAYDLARALRRAVEPVAVMPGDWARAAAGGSVVVGSRAAAWAPAPDLAVAVVVDEHDEAYQEERAPTWNARDVVVERARRTGARCLLLSPCPSLDVLECHPLLVASRASERAGWPALEVIDRRREPPGQGLFSSRLVAVAREGGRVLCVLNRKGRARLLACAECGELARCEACASAVSQGDDGLVCGRCGATRPAVCGACGSQRLKALRVGVSRAREELEALVRRTVTEVTADGAPPEGLAADAVVVGTEAVLHRVALADVVAFLDFDQELLAPRYRAGEEALALLARAARVVGGRFGGKVLVQTRIPGHEALEAAVHADPGRFAVVESARRAALGFPPHAALAAVSGEEAEVFVARVTAAAGVESSGAVGARWLLRAPDHRVLCDALAAAERPAGRLRVEVDPLRA